MLHGVAIRIESGRSFTLGGADGQSLEIKLVGLEIDDNGAAAREPLVRLVLGRSVHVLYNPEFPRGRRLLGVANVDGKPHDLSRRLLEEGAAKYEQPPFCSVSEYSSCLYRIAEREAKQAGLRCEWWSEGQVIKLAGKIAHCHCHRPK